VGSFARKPWSVPVFYKQNLEARRDAANRFAERLSGVLLGLKASGASQRQMVGHLNDLDIRAARGGEWSLAQVQRILRRVEVKAADKKTGAEAPV